MATSIAEFVRAVDAYGILTADTLAGHARGVDPQADASSLASRLVNAGLLTAFQCKHIYGGRAASLLIGPYVILDTLGKGGMGHVYKAEHRKMRRIVALKVISRSWLNRPSAIRRFDREVQVLARLEHPNVITAHDAGEVAGMHYLVMQFVEGRNARQIVTELGPQPAAQAIGWILQAARGLAFAHEKGVVHRDVKPANILVDASGTVKVLDLGIARLDAHGAHDIEQDQLTSTGQIFGTPDFMAPEQALDMRQADARSDIYALGATLWYLLVGRTMFEADSIAQKIMAHQTQPVPNLPPSLAVSAPGLQAIFQRMVAKRPRDRFQSMTELIAAMESLRRPPGAADADAPGRLRSSPPVEIPTQSPRIKLYGRDTRSG